MEPDILSEKVVNEMASKTDPFDFSHYWRPFRNDTTRVWDVLPYHDGYPNLLRNTETLAYLIRSYTVYEMTCAALGHPGGSLPQLCDPRRLAASLPEPR